MSMPTLPKTSFLAVLTNTLPGPHILSTRGTVAVPYAMAAMAWAPPALYTASAPVPRREQNLAGLTLPSLSGGVHTMTSLTPAALAGTTVINTVDMSGAVPLGT